MLRQNAKLQSRMKSPNEPNAMFNDLRDFASVIGVNVAAIALSLSELEQHIRIVAGISAIAYTLVKTYKLLQK